MFLFVILLSGLGISIQYLDQIENFLSNMEISMSSALAEGDSKIAPTKTATEAQTNLQTTAAPALDGSVAQAAGGAPDDSTDYLFKLAARKKELDQREAELVRREEQVTKLKEEVEGKLKEIQGYRNNIAVLLQDRVATDSAKVDTLVQVYSNMKPSQAAKVFETMDEDLVIEILSKMKKKNAADILNLVKADKAQVLAEKYAGYRLTGGRKTASEDSSSNQMDAKNNAQNNPTNQKEDSEE
jgi:flagellar motility protein MotE (MotC chaperone)